MKTWSTYTAKNGTVEHKLTVLDITLAVISVFEDNSFVVVNLYDVEYNKFYGYSLHAININERWIEKIKAGVEQRVLEHLEKYNRLLVNFKSLASEVL